MYLELYPGFQGELKDAVRAESRIVVDWSIFVGSHSNPGSVERVMLCNNIRLLYLRISSSRHRLVDSFPTHIYKLHSRIVYLQPLWINLGVHQLLNRRFNNRSGALLHETLSFALPENVRDWQEICARWLDALGSDRQTSLLFRVCPVSVNGLAIWRDEHAKCRHFKGAFLLCNDLRV